jgi:hypothetical protein
MALPRNRRNHDKTIGPFDVPTEALHPFVIGDAEGDLPSEPLYVSLGVTREAYIPQGVFTARAVYARFYVFDAVIIIDLLLFEW